MTTDPLIRTLIQRMPRFMYPEIDRIETADDLLFQVQHEIDLAEEGDLQWTSRQMAIAKGYQASVKKILEVN